MDSTKQKKKKLNSQNILESLRDIGSSAASSTTKDVIKPNEVLNQIFGRMPQKNYSGEIGAGESIEMKNVLSGKEEETQKLKKQISYERGLKEEDVRYRESKSNELRIKLKVLMQEVVKLASSTQELTEEVKVATMQAPVEPGMYHVAFFEKLLEFVKSYRKKVEDASIWLHATNTRAQKKNYWASYKKHGSKFLLSGEHYLTRSAG